MSLRPGSAISCAFLLVALLTAPALAQPGEILPFRGPFELAQDCTLSPVVLESGSQTVAVWTSSRRIEARSGASLEEMGDPVLLWDGGQGSYHAGISAIPLPGGFLVAWAASSPDGKDRLLYTARFDLALAPSGPLTIAAAGLERQSGQRPALSALPDGSHLLAWVAEGADSEAPNRLRVQRFLASGESASPPLEIAEDVETVSGFVEMSLAPAGDTFAVGWHRSVSGVHPRGFFVKVQTYDGSPSSPEIHLGENWGTVVATATGFVAIRAENQGGLFARELAFDGSPLGDEVELLATGSLGDSAIQAATAGNGVWVVWNENLVPAWSSHLVGTRIDLATLTATPPSVVVAPPPPPDPWSESFLPRATSLRSAFGGRFLLSWQRGHNPAILPTPCDAGLAIHAGIFGFEGEDGSSPVDVPASTRATALHLSILLALAALVALRRG